MTTPTAALVEEAEKWDRETPAGPWQFAHCGAHRDYDKWLPCLGVRDENGKRVENIDRHMPAARRLIPEFAAALRRTEAELDAATTQLAKKFKRLEELERRCTQAESERDELRATVTRLNRRAQTAEAGVRDNVEASKTAGKSMGRTLANAAADMYRRRAEKAEAERDAQHAEVLRLTGERDALAKDLARIRAVSAIANSVAHWDSLLNEMHKQKAKVSELTATRDLLNEENARLQARVATLELLLRGGK